MATGGSLLGAAGKWRECCWAVWCSLDYDEEMGPLHGMCGSVEAELEVQRTIKRAEMTAFLCLLRKVSGPIKVHGNNRWEQSMGYEKVEKQVNQAKSRRCRPVDKQLGRTA